MRIAFVSYEFPPEMIGGIGTYASHASQMLASRGHAVTVYSSTTHPAPREEWHGDVRVKRLPCLSRRTFHRIAVPALAAEHALRAFDVAEVPDLYAEGLGLRDAVPDVAIVLRAHTPSYIAHEVDFHALPPFGRGLSALRRLLGGARHGERWREIGASARGRLRFRDSFDWHGDPERRVALQADVIAPPSQRLAARLRTDWRIPAHKLQVVPYPHIAASDLLALAPSSDPRTIAFHGSVRYFKGVHDLVAAMTIVLSKHPDARLVLAGASAMSPVPDSSWRAWREDRMVGWRDTLEWLRPQLAALGGRAVVRGFLSRENLTTHLAEAGICVFPSLFDNFPNACLEAMSAGRVIVATRSGGMEEMLGEDGGLLVDPGSAKEIADAICRLIDDPPLRMQLALRARERLLTRYAPSAVAPLHEALYERAQSVRRAAPRVSSAP